MGADFDIEEFQNNFQFSKELLINYRMIHQENLGRSAKKDMDSEVIEALIHKHWLSLPEDFKLAYEGRGSKSFKDIIDDLGSQTSYLGC